MKRKLIKIGLLTSMSILVTFSGYSNTTERSYIDINRVSCDNLNKCSIHFIGEAVSPGRFGDEYALQPISIDGGDKISER